MRAELRASGTDGSCQRREQGRHATRRSDRRLYEYKDCNTGPVFRRAAQRDSRLRGRVRTPSLDFPQRQRRFKRRSRRLLPLQ